MKDIAWKYCTGVEKEEAKVQCNLCKKYVSLGRSKKTQSIALFNYHLERYHSRLYSDLYKEPAAEDKSSTEESSSKRKAEEDPDSPCEDKARTKKARQELYQKTIPQTIQEKEPFPFHSARAQEIHKALAEYLCVDLVAFDAVNSSGFLRLLKILEISRSQVASHTYYKSQVQVIFEKLKSKLIAKVASDNPSDVACTLDGWSENHSGVLVFRKLFRKVKSSLILSRSDRQIALPPSTSLRRPLHHLCGIPRKANKVNFWERNLILSKER